MKTQGIYRRIWILVILVFVFTYNSFAQPDLPDPPPENPVPITGIEYLIAAGAAFGAKKIFDKRKSNSK